VGVNLIPNVTEFLLQKVFFIKINSSVDIPENVFVSQNGSVEEGCASEGLHTILKFNFILKNIGDKDLEIGNPLSRPDIFEPSKHDSKKFLTKKRVNEYYLKDSKGNIVSFGYKRYFCINDNGNFNCDNQGISAGNQDTYSINELCNFLVIDNIDNGIYLFEACTNVSKIFEEDSYDDNTLFIKLSINKDTRTVTTT
jgi:hypothetical protein